MGLGVQFIKLGGLSRGERVTKYNRIFTIEEELVQNGTLGMCCLLAFFSLGHEQENKDGKRGNRSPPAGGQGAPKTRNQS